MHLTWYKWQNFARNLPCFAHSLNLVIENAIRSIKEEFLHVLNDNDDEISSKPADTIQLFYKSPKATRTRVDTFVSRVCCLKYFFSSMILVLVQCQKINSFLSHHYL